MINVRYIFSIVLFVTLATGVTFIAGCNKNDNVTGTSTSVNDYIRAEAVSSTDESNGDDNEALGTEVSDFSDDGATFDNDGTGSTPIDSLRKYGRRVTGFNIDVSFTYDSDTLKTVLVTRTITGNFIISGYIGGVLDSISKPYTEVQHRTASFRRVASTDIPRRDWRLYQVSMVDGQTTTPQAGKSNITVSKVEVYNNSTLAYTFLGPDFTSNVFTTKYFDASGIPGFHRGDVLHVKVYLNSNQTDPDIIAYHWARNAFGFHRERFAMTAQTINGSTYDRIYEKDFTIFSGHRLGVTNGFLSANTNASLWSSNVAAFSSTYLGMPFRVKL